MLTKTLKHKVLGSHKSIKFWENMGFYKKMYMGALLVITGAHLKQQELTLMSRVVEVRALSLMENQSACATTAAPPQRSVLLRSEH